MNRCNAGSTCGPLEPDPDPKLISALNGGDSLDELANDKLLKNVLYFDNGVDLFLERLRSLRDAFAGVNQGFILQAMQSKKCFGEN